MHYFIKITKYLLSDHQCVIFYKSLSTKTTAKLNFKPIFYNEICFELKDIKNPINIQHNKMEKPKKTCNYSKLQ